MRIVNGFNLGLVKYKYPNLRKNDGCFFLSALNYLIQKAKSMSLPVASIIKDTLLGDHHKIDMNRGKFE